MSKRLILKNIYVKIKNLFVLFKEFFFKTALYNFIDFIWYNIICDIDDYINFMEKNRRKIFKQKFTFKFVLKILLYFFLFFSGLLIIVGLVLFIWYLLKYFFKYFFLICDYFLENKKFFWIKIYEIIKYLISNIFIYIPKFLKKIKDIIFYIISLKWIKFLIIKFFVKPLDDFLFNCLVLFEKTFNWCYIIYMTFDPNIELIRFKRRLINKFFEFKKFIKSSYIIVEIIYYLTKLIKLIIYYIFFFKNFLKFFFSKWFWLYLEIYLSIFSSSVYGTISIIYYYINYQIRFFFFKNQLFIKYYILKIKTKLYYKKLIFQSFFIKKFILNFKYFIIILRYVILLILNFILKNFFWFFIIYIKYLGFILFEKIYLNYYMPFLGLKNWFSYWVEITSIYYFWLRNYKLILNIFNIFDIFNILLSNKHLYKLYLWLVQLYIYLIIIFFSK